MGGWKFFEGPAGCDKSICHGAVFDFLKGGNGFGKEKDGVPFFSPDENFQGANGGPIHSFLMPRTLFFGMVKVGTGGAQLPTS